MKKAKTEIPIRRTDSFTGLTEDDRALFVSFGALAMAEIYNASEKTLSLAYRAFYLSLQNKLASLGIASRFELGPTATKARPASKTSRMRKNKGRTRK